MRLLLKLSVLFFILYLLSSSNSFSQENNTADEKTIKAIINKFSDEDPYVKGKAITEIVKYGTTAADYLIESLDDESDEVRWCSAIALGKIAPEGTSAIQFLIRALNDSNSNVRWCSAIALGKFNKEAESAIPKLVGLLNDEDEYVRWAAYVSLTKINKESINHLPDLAELITKIDSFTAKLMNELNVPGVTITTIKNHKIVYSKSFGVADVNSQLQVTNNTIFEACSMSKPVFAYIVLKLVEQKKLDLDKPLSNYLSEEFVCENDDYPNQITARMILSHTSGLPNWRKGEEERNPPLPIYFNPGDHFSYSGEGMFYLQRVIEKITGEPLEKYAEETLFKPLGLEHTSYIWTEKIDSTLSCGHDTSGQFLAKSKYLHSNSAYSLYTTSEDYARFIIEILKPDRSSYYSLSKYFLEEMMKPQVDVLVRDPISRPGRYLGLFVYWGLGWAIDSTASGKIVYHSGANRTGFRCYSQFNPEEGSGIVIMTNSLNGSALWRRLIKEIGNL